MARRERPSRRIGVGSWLIPLVSVCISLPAGLLDQRSRFSVVSSSESVGEPQIFLRCFSVKATEGAVALQGRAFHLAAFAEPLPELTIFLAIKRQGRILRPVVGLRAADLHEIERRQEPAEAVGARQIALASAEFGKCWLRPSLDNFAS